MQKAKKKKKKATETRGGKENTWNGNRCKEGNGHHCKKNLAGSNQGVLWNLKHYIVT